MKSNICFVFIFLLAQLINKPTNCSKTSTLSTKFLLLNKDFVKVYLPIFLK